MMLSLKMRDLNQVRDKLKVVLMPLGQESQNSVIQKLRDCKFITDVYRFQLVVFILITYYQGTCGGLF